MKPQGMKLTELEPCWLSTTVFVFLCPHCRATLLSCKTAAMPMGQQVDLFRATLGEDWNMRVVPTRPETAWRVTASSFDSMTVHPSLDASASGHWHGHILKGRVVPS